MTFLATAVALAIFAWVNSLLQGSVPGLGNGNTGPRPIGTVLAGTTVVLATSLFQALLVAPLAIATHRFVLLDEHAPRHPSRIVKTTLRFALWATALQCAGFVSYFLKASGVPDALFFEPIISLVAFIVTVRLALVFPAIAIEAPDAPAQASWHDTRRRFWRTAAALFVTAFPFLIVVGLGLVLFIRTTNGTFHANVAAPLFACIAVSLVAALAAVASWLFIGYRQASYFKG